MSLSDSTMVSSKYFMLIGMMDHQEQDAKELNTLKHRMEKCLYSTSTGKWFGTIRIKSNVFMGIISFFSSLAFVILTYWDLSKFDSCC